MPDVLSVADACVERVKAGWDAAKPEASVERVYEFLVPDIRKGLASLEGRCVFFFPAGYGEPGIASRGEDVCNAVVSALVIERYPYYERPVPRDWLDERVRWAKAKVFDALCDPRLPRLLSSPGKPDTTGVIPIEPQCDLVFDLIELTNHAAFWGEFTFTFTWHE